MNKITDIFFDLDHTLWDFDENSKITFDLIFKKNNITISLNAFLEAYKPINLALWELYRDDKISKEHLRYTRLKQTFDQLNFTVSDEMINQVAKDYITYLSKQTYLIPGALSVLEYLKPKYRLHIITNGFQEVQDFKLRNSEIDHFFEVVVNSEMAGVKKPKPEIFYHALSLAGTKVENAIMIGDSLKADVEGALAIKMDAILFNYHQESDVNERIKCIDRLEELRKFL